MANTFFKAQGFTIGKSLVEDDMMPMALDPTTINDLILGCGQPAGEAGFNIARVTNCGTYEDFQERYDNSKKSGEKDAAWG